MTDWKERAERAEAELARLRADMEFYRNFAAEVLAVKRLPMPHDMEALCRTAYDNRYHKIKADMSYDNWRLVWIRAIASHEAAPPAQPANIDAAFDAAAQALLERGRAQPAEPQRLTDAQVTVALQRAYSLGQTYWQQADSDFTSEHRKADATHAKFKALIAETIEAAPKATK